MENIALLKTIVIEEYVREVVLTKSQRPKFYEVKGANNYIVGHKGKKVLQKYLLPLYKDFGKITESYMLRPEYAIGMFKSGKLVSVGSIPEEEKDPIFNSKYTKSSKFYLINRITRELIYSNDTQIGKSKVSKIRGQEIYSGVVHWIIRQKWVDVIKGQMNDSFTLEDKSPINTKDYPIIIEVEIIDNVENFIWDVDNRIYLYNKCFQDVLQDIGVIVNDDRLHITGPPRTLFTPAEENESPKLIYKIYKDTREVIKNNKKYQELSININNPKIKKENGELF